MVALNFILLMTISGIIIGALLAVYFNVMDGPDTSKKIYANLILSVLVGLSCWATFGKFKMCKLYGLDGHAWAVHHEREFDLVRNPCKCSGWRMRPLSQKLKDMVFELEN